MRRDRAPLSAYTLPKLVKRPALRRQVQPDAVRLYYYAGLRAIMAKAHALVTAELLPVVGDIRRDSAEDESRVKEKLRDIAARFSRNVGPGRLKPLVQTVAERTAAFQKAQLQRQLADAMGVQPFIHDAGLAAAAEAFTTTNVALIKTVPARYFEGVEQVVLDGVTRGARASTIASEMEERYSVSESDAARIANDQVGKLFGALNQSRQEDLGITGYEWATAHDGRVRVEHRQLDGQAFQWSDPPMGGGTDDGEAGHPGSGISCRCQALPVLDPEIFGQTPSFESAPASS